MYRWIVFLHVLGALGFLWHTALRRREKALDRIRAMLDLSNAALPIAYSSMALMLGAGIIAGIMGNWFSQGWIWAALVVIVVMWFGMHYYAYRYYTPIRKAVGLPYRDLGGDQPAQPPASDSEIAAVIQASNPLLLLGVSFGLVAVILWLMMFKPF